MTPNENTIRLMDEGNKVVLNVSECGIILDLNFLQVRFVRWGQQNSVAQLAKINIKLSQPNSTST